MAVDNVTYSVNYAEPKNFETLWEAVDYLQSPQYAEWYTEFRDALDAAVSYAQANPVCYTKITKWQDGSPQGVPLYLIGGTVLINAD